MIGLFDETSYSPYYIDYLNMDKLNSLLLKPEISAVAELRLFVTELVWMATHLLHFHFYYHCVPDLDLFSVHIIQYGYLIVFALVN